MDEENAIDMFDDENRQKQQEEEVIDLLEDFDDREFDEEVEEEQIPENEEQDIDEMEEPKEDELYNPEEPTLTPAKPAGKILLSSADLLASPERPRRKTPLPQSRPRKTPTRKSSRTINIILILKI